MKIKNEIDKPQYATVEFWTNPENIDEIYIQHHVSKTDSNLHQVVLLHHINPDSVVTLYLPHEGRLKVTHAGLVTEKHIGTEITSEIFNHYKNTYNLWCQFIG